MYLVAAEARPQSIERASVPRPSARWADFPPSCLSHHGAPCCALAIEWLRTMDFAQLNGAGLRSGPRWLREKYKWGPTAWPLYWCDAVKRETLDCGAHSALAQVAFEARGITCLRAQLVQRYNLEAVGQWRAAWAEASDHWLGDDFIYHEANALLLDRDSVKIWDGSASCWVKPVQTGGYGSTMSIRIVGGDRSGLPPILRWGNHRLAANEWNELA